MGSCFFKHIHHMRFLYILKSPLLDMYKLFQTQGIVIPVLLLTTFLATVVYGGPSEEDVVSAINEAKRINMVKREFNKLMKRMGGPSSKLAVNFFLCSSQAHLDH